MPCGGTASRAPWREPNKRIPSHEPEMKISIVIPAFNEEKLLPVTIQSVQSALSAFHDRGWQTEIVVCDNNSTDGTARLARACGAKVVFEPVNQIGRARNSGAAAASGEWLIFVDADSEPSVELFAEVAERINSGRVLAGGALVALNGGPLWARLVTRLWGLYSRLARHMAGAFIYVETAAFRQIGGFSPKLFAGEELELSQRLKRIARLQGKRIEIITSARLKTSARKVKLYTPRETARFLTRAFLRPHRTLTNRDECAIWYDGRR